MARRPSAYQSGKGDDSLEALSDMLSADLRGAIKALGTFPLLSEEWCNMARTLGRIAEASDAEVKLSRDCAGGEHKRGDKTLWEGEELALRHVLEDGKLNMCLRNLVDLREFQRKRRDTVGLADERPSTQVNLDAFEKGMGAVLRNAWTHIEALQTTDIPLLVEYITGVIQEAAEDPERMERMSQRGDLLDRQEVVCLSYFRGLLSRLSEYDESRVMPHVRAAGTTAWLASMLRKNHEYLGKDASTVGAQALALVFDTEDFATYRDHYISDRDKETFASLREEFVTGLCEDPQTRKALRPLLDVIAYCQRTRSRT